MRVQGSIRVTLPTSGHSREARCEIVSHSRIKHEGNQGDSASIDPAGLPFPGSEKSAALLNRSLASEPASSPGQAHRREG